MDSMIFVSIFFFIRQNHNSTIGVKERSSKCFRRAYRTASIIWYDDECPRREGSGQGGPEGPVVVPKVSLIIIQLYHLLNSI